MNKRLKKYTTIPEHLYVNRNADIQLKRIIDDMQRPGYVLVARQMGKTNLLFNAKRTLENEKRLFVYVDLSNLFDNERDCYRNIIDNIIEPNLNFFEYIEDEIENIRAKKLQPHNEYSRCLRTILKFFTGDLVIVLDEIDAIKSVDYSDNIFAQIRSNYFSRTNFPEFERLTYVLSGVIEPAELIKDPNKSPFNIGDKIYLDDFTKDEHKDFIQKSELRITQEISDEIFNWACGNPRITFDICSEIESYVLDNIEATKDLLEKIIKQKYLTTFDVAPIDHIRELIKADGQVRKSVSLINTGRQSELSDEDKKKLYLFGIIDSNFDKRTTIKNKVIGNSLSEEWIQSIDKQSVDNFAYGLDQMDMGDFSGAILSFKSFLNSVSPSTFQLEASNYNLGFAYYTINDHFNAIDYFSQDYSTEPYKKNAFCFLGICKVAVGKQEEGAEILEEVIRVGANDFAYRHAILALVPILFEDQVERSLSLYNSLYESTFNPTDRISEIEVNQLRTLSLFYQAELYLKISKSDKALDKINEALKFSKGSDSLILIYYKYHLDSNKDEALKSKLVSEIIDNQFDFDRKNFYSITFKENLLYTFLNLIFDASDLTLFENLLDYSNEKLLPATNKYKIIYESSLAFGENKLNLLNYLTTLSEHIDENLLIRIYWDLALKQVDNEKQFFSSFIKYLSLFFKTGRLEGEDIYLFAIAAKLNFEKGDLLEVVRICNIIEPKLANLTNEDAKLESSIIYYWLAESYYRLKNRISAKENAILALDIISNSKKKSTSVMDETGIATISRQLEQLKNLLSPLNPVKKSRKYGVNEKVKVRYSDGREIEKKYKHIQADIVSNRCIIIP